MDGNRLDRDGARGAGAESVSVALSFSIAIAEAVTIAISVTISITVTIAISVTFPVAVSITLAEAVLARVLEEPPERFQSVLRRGRGTGHG